MFERVTKNTSIDRRANVRLAAVAHRFRLSFCLSFLRYVNVDAGVNGRHANPNEDVELPKQKTNIICTLGPVSRTVDVLERMLRAGMRVARFNFSHGSHEYHQETLDALRAACENTGIFCAVLLDTKGPEIRTGMLENGEPVALERRTRSCVHHRLRGQGQQEPRSRCPTPASLRDVTPGSKILCADGSITLTVVSCDVNNGTVLVNCENAAKLGERKNMNLPGVNVDLPTITEKDRDDLLNWGVKNKVDFVAASFVRKGKDVEYIREVLGEAGKDITHHLQGGEHGGPRQLRRHRPPSPTA